MSVFRRSLYEGEKGSTDRQIARSNSVIPDDHPRKRFLIKLNFQVLTQILKFLKKTGQNKTDQFFKTVNLVFSNVKWGASSQIGPNDYRKDVTHFMILVKIFFR